MSLIQQQITKTLYAYLTPKGRKYILDGDKEDFQVEYFSLHDSDTNYVISSNIVSGNTYNSLQAGFVPDITGDNEGCIKSISKSTSVNNNSTIFGSTILVNNLATVGKIGTSGEINDRVLSVSIPTTSSTTNINSINNKTFTLSLNLPTDDITPVKLNELNRSTIKITVDQVSTIFSNVLINGKKEEIFTFSSNTITIPVSFQQGAIPASGTITGTITFKVEIYRSFLNLINNTYTIIGTVTGGGGTQTE